MLSPGMEQDLGKAPFDKRSLDLRSTLFMDYIERNLYLMRYLLCARMTFPFIFPSSCLLITLWGHCYNPGSADKELALSPVATLEFHARSIAFKTRVTNWWSMSWVCPTDAFSLAHAEFCFVFNKLELVTNIQKWSLQLEAWISNLLKKGKIYDTGSLHSLSCSPIFLFPVTHSTPLDICSEQVHFRFISDGPSWLQIQSPGKIFKVHSKAFY